ncbi:MAG: acetylornithine/succinylornithine family transaminase [SAR324 cluster bacterium]|nr:acetylornithine/succinylornithine family transaminase [SAR324 cluster bacterium]
MSVIPVAAALSGTDELIQEAEKSLMYVVTRPGNVMVAGKGSYIWDADGRKFLDCIQGWAVNALGHCPPVLTRALTKQAKQLINGSPSLYNEPMIQLAKLLTDHSCLDKVFFANSGAEANEGAVKLARKYGALRRAGAHEIITTWHSFHGRTLSMMSASGKQPWDNLFEPKVPGFIRVPFNDLNAVRNAINSKTCAIMLEPVQGEGGVHVAGKAYMQGLRKLCDETGVLLILDEIQTGIGRTGTLFAYEQYGVEPDIMTLGKGIGGGFPLSALMAKDEVCVFEQGDQGGTFCGQPLAMVAGLAVVGEVIAKNISGRAKSRGRYLVRRLKALGEQFGFTEVRGKGLLVAVELPQEKGPEIVQECFDQGLLINAPGPTTLRFMPALNISNAQVDEMMDILSAALRKVL